MSGECTVTPGKTWSGDPVTDANLNQAANPVVQVNEDAIGPRELDVAAVTPLIVGGTTLDNWLRNPLFAVSQAHPGASYVANVRQNSGAAGWYFIGTAGLVTVAPSYPGSGVGKGLLCTISAGSTNITVGQCLGPEDGLQLTGRTIAVSVEIYCTETISPRCRLRTWGTENDASTGTQVYDAAPTSGSSSVTASTLTRCNWTIELNTTAGIDVSKGFDLQFYAALPSTTYAPTLTYYRPQLVIAGGDTAFGVGTLRQMRRFAYGAAVPGATQDIDKGWMVGDEMIWDKHYRCFANTAGAAVWRPTTDVVRLINRWSSMVTTTGSTTTAIPYDDTIPQSAEGAEIMTVTITPTSTSNKLVVHASGYCTISSTGNVTVAVFVDSTADAVFAKTIRMVGGYEVPFDFRFEMTVPSTASQTWKLRLGPSAGTAYWNRGASGTLLGSVDGMLFEIQEVTNT